MQEPENPTRAQRRVIRQNGGQPLSVILYHLYVEQDTTIPALAEQLEISDSQAYAWLQQCELTKRQLADQRAQEIRPEPAA